MIRLDTLVGGRERLASKVCFWKRRNVLWSKLSKICREKDSSILTKEVYFFSLKGMKRCGALLHKFGKIYEKV
jgi:hypothetical protein